MVDLLLRRVNLLYGDYYRLLPKLLLLSLMVWNGARSYYVSFSPDLTKQTLPTFKETWSKQ